MTKAGKSISEETRNRPAGDLESEANDLACRADDKPKHDAVDGKRLKESASLKEPDDDNQKLAEKKPLITWERTIEVAKLIATVWVALLGSFVTMQFNERQHELNRIEAIAQMLPHMSEEAKDGQTNDHMGRDGAIWAIFRTANNRTMLRDLAALFPEDIYRVVSSIALAGELNHDNDAVVALQVASEKLAAEYSSDPKKAELASKLYAQALALKERKADDPSPLRVVELTSSNAASGPTDDQLTGLLKSINNLADVHLKDSSSGKARSGSSHWQSKQLYLRAREIGLNNQDDQIQEQVMRADLSLASLYVKDQLADDAFKYLKEALQIEAQITGQKESAYLKSLDADGDGFAALPEMSSAVNQAELRFKDILEKYKDKGAQIKG